MMQAGEVQTALTEPPHEPVVPQVGILRVKYGKAKHFRGRCTTCSPEWRGPFQKKERQAFDDSLNHASTVHKWVPKQKDADATE